MREAAALTPMFRQYRALKDDQPDAILLFRMGDFYEMFFDDAKVASRLLELTLTARGKGTDLVVPMCGFPHHQLDAYTAKLVMAGQRVAVCDQVEDPRKAKGLVRREVVRVVTPGTVTDPAQLEAKENHWMAAVSTAAERIGAAFLDLSTGELLVWESDDDAGRPWQDLADRLRSFGPREVVHPEGFAWSEEFRREVAAGCAMSEVDAYVFHPSTAEALLLRHLDVRSLDGFGLRDRPAAVGAAGGLLQYLQDTQKCGLEHVNDLRVHEPARQLLLDPATRRNLELERSLRDGGRKHTLFHAVDSTVTSGGGRLLRRWLLAPLLDTKEIGRRQDVVQELLDKPALREGAREALGGVHDVERLLGRAVHGSANARDLLSLCRSLENVPRLVAALAGLEAALGREILDGVDPCEDVARLLAGAIVDEPPANLRDGGFIRDGHDAELDELRAVSRDGKSYISSLEQAEREATGIPSLKVKYNKVFGYFLEVSKANLHRVPERYHRKQTIANGERFVTPELKEYESKVLTAQERIETLELELFQRLRSQVAAEAPRLQAVARVAATLDVLGGLAETAAAQRYCRPQVTDGRRLHISGGRHPVIERTLDAERFVPNDTELELGARAIGVLTGPNMGGKSTYLRQVALIVLLAQTGSFVPADAAEVGVVDRIFCRVGASDSLAEGQSTFMVEMAETANILHHATSRSLLLLDEIGRGTSTFDGLSIAWAVIEHLHARTGGAPRTLFATHYHELTELEVELGSVLNLRMAVRERGDRVLFLHRVELGASDRSYGIHVARLAGVPRSVVERAGEILENLERDEFGGDGLPRRARSRDPRRAAELRGQASLFGAEPGGAEPPRTPPAVPHGVAEVLSELRGQEVDRLTPVEALNLLERWQRRLQAGDGAD
jgi:DNA mismatch repair protein MutS